MISAPHWHVLGAGAIGSLLAQQLLSIGCQCTLLHHRSTAQKRRVKSNGHSHEIAVNPLDQLGPSTVERLIVTTKAGQVAAAVALAASCLAEGAVVICMANGLGFEDAVTQQNPSLKLYRAVSTAAAYRESEDTVHAAATGSTRLGLPGESAAAPHWFEDSLRRLKGWRWTVDVDPFLGEKFALNCAINALTAVRRCRNGELLEPPDALAQLCEEIEAPLRALGLWRRDSSLFDEASALCRLTASNRSSMLQDVLAGRATELAFLNGELQRRAVALGFELPLNAQLVARLSALP